MRHYPPVGENESKEAQVASMFDAIAKRYDFLNRVLSFGLDGFWRREAIQKLGTQKGKRILDVATGTGDVALSLLRLHPEKVVGVDIAEKMLENARKKRIPRYYTGELSFVQGSAESLPLLTSTYDAAIVAFGVRNFANLDAGLRSIERVLKPKSPLVVLEFGQPTSPFVRRLYQFYSRFILPTIGQSISGVRGPYDYLPDSIEEFPSGHAFLQRLLECGFEHTQSETLTCGIVHLYTGYATGKNHSDEL